MIKNDIIIHLKSNSNIYLILKYQMVLIVYMKTKYGLDILPLIRYIWTSHPSITQSWYSDDSGAGGKFTDIQRLLDNVMVRGPPQGYFPDSTKSILVMSQRSVPQSEALFWEYGLQVVTGSRYLGVFVGMEMTQARWLED